MSLFISKIGLVDRKTTRTISIKKQIYRVFFKNFLGIPHTFLIGYHLFIPVVKKKMWFSTSF
jgi:hypothetical protein